MDIFRDGDDVAICPKLGIDSDLTALMGKKDITLPILQLYHAWRRGICEESHKITASEYTALIEKVGNLLPENTWKTDIQLRDQILASQARMKVIAEEGSKDLELSAAALLKRGQNPGNWLRQLREEISEDIPFRVNALRQKDLNIGHVNEKDAERTLVQDNLLIKALRKRDKTPNKAIMTQNQWEARAPKPIYPGENKPVENVSDTIAKHNSPGKRITFRLDDNLYAQIQRRCQEIGIDYSALIRSAIVLRLEGESESKGIVDMGMPAEALARIGKYQVWGSDLKERLRENFLQLLAMAYVTERRWLKTKWVKQLYQGLLPLSRHLETDCVRQD